MRWPSASILSKTPSRLSLRLFLANIGYKATSPFSWKDTQLFGNIESGVSWLAISSITIIFTPTAFSLSTKASNSSCAFLLTVALRSLVDF
jgi:hypothetical protein